LIIFLVMTLSLIFASGMIVKRFTPLVGEGRNEIERQISKPSEDFLTKNILNDFLNSEVINSNSEPILTKDLFLFFSGFCLTEDFFSEYFDYSFKEGLNSFFYSTSDLGINVFQGNVLLKLKSKDYECFIDFVEYFDLGTDATTIQISSKIDNEILTLNDFIKKYFQDKCFSYLLVTPLGNYEIKTDKDGLVSFVGNSQYSSLGNANFALEKVYLNGNEFEFKLYREGIC